MFAPLTSLSLAYSSPNTAKNYLIWASNQDISASPAVASDSIGNVVTPLTAVADTTSELGDWCVPNCGAGANTVTMTFPSTATFCEIYVNEISGVANLLPVAFTGQLQNGPTGTDSVSSGTVSTTVPTFCWALSRETANTGVGDAPNVGTGFTLDLETWNVDALGNSATTEFKASVPAGTNSATFTPVNPGPDNFTTLGVWLAESDLARPALYNPYYAKRPLNAPDVYPDLLGTTLKSSSTLPGPLGHVNKDWPDTPRFAPESTAFMLVTTIGGSATPASTNVTRPPLMFAAGMKSPLGSVDVYPNLLAGPLRPVVHAVGAVLSASAPYSAPKPGVDVFPNLLNTTLKASATAPKTVQLSASAPRVQQTNFADAYPNLSGATLARGVLSTTIQQLSMPAPVQKWPPGVDVYPNLSGTTLVPGTHINSAQLSVSAPPLKWPPGVDVYPNLLATTLNSAAALRLATQLSASAPYRAPPPGIDVLPNLLTTTLAASTTPPKVVRLDTSAPSRWIPPQVDAYPNLITTTLHPVPAALSALRVDASAPAQKWPPSVDVYPNLLATLLKPVPAPLSFGRLDASAPYKWPKTQVDVYPDLLNTTLARPFVTVRKLDTSAPFKYAPLTVDTYPNLLGTTLVVALALPPGSQLSDSTPELGFSRLGIDVYPSLFATTGPTPPPAPVFPVQFAGRYLTHARLQVQLSHPRLSVQLYTSKIRISLSRAGYVA